MEKFLKPIPGVLHFHAGRMAASHRSMVDQTYQVALNLPSPCLEGLGCQRVVVYDFE